MARPIAAVAEQENIFVVVALTKDAGFGCGLFEQIVVDHERGVDVGFLSLFLNSIGADAGPCDMCQCKCPQSLVKEARMYHRRCSSIRLR